MNSYSGGWLPAYAVMSAREQVILDIYKGREHVTHAMAQHSGILGWMLGDRELTDDEWDIVNEHRRQEEAAVEQLRDVAEAVACDGPEFRVCVSTGDFQYIRKAYRVYVGADL